MNHMLLAAGLSFAVCVVVFPFYIGWLKKRQIQQFIREEGPQSHAAKAKTPEDKKAEQGHGAAPGWVAPRWGMPDGLAMR